MEGKRLNKVVQEKIKYPLLYEVKEYQLICPANYSAQSVDVEWVQHCASVDTRKHLELGVAGGRYKPVCSVDKALDIQCKCCFNVVVFFSFFLNNFFNWLKRL